MADAERGRAGSSRGSRRASAGAISAPGDGQVEPRAVVAALAAALAAAGGELCEGTEVAELTGDDGRVNGVRTAAGETIAAGHVLAAGAWSGQRAVRRRAGRARVRPVKGQLLRAERRRGSPAAACRVVRTPRCYVVCRATAAVVIGATTEERGFDTDGHRRRRVPAARGGHARCCPTWPSWSWSGTARRAAARHARTAGR